jgi:hypothetical protein
MYPDTFLVCGYNHIKTSNIDWREYLVLKIGVHRIKNVTRTKVQRDTTMVKPKYQITPKKNTPVVNLNYTNLYTNQNTKYIKIQIHP